MSNETKRDVVEAILLAKDTDTIWDSSNVRYYLNRYDAALPDNLPVIPKAVGKWIKECKHRNVTLADTLCMEMRPENVRNWMAFKDGDIANDFDRAGYLRKQDLMARAWVLGVWRVEETGEIVKLEAEK
ncbi:hypothetical protein [Lacticaseibacillus paracasei]|uniref:Phage protein n=1 Tax=Lacticaseibacillus paracasei TaxID=1597 RepID=A0A8B3GT82_LACPA|nr:hypothetical protein [Lacticaseibacillus paracasei]RNE28552.1 hypothetical protein FAM6012_02254 [Lacticaseibacillus paracasei]